ncbi:MAG: Glycosyl transferase family 2 [uncultured bacterium]|nr:MAG: Glycosyl transferase family 2 [uncultured bacterium]
MTVDLIIPAYNEERRIGRTLLEYISFFDSQVHFLVVLNNCNDGTLAVVQDFQKRFPGRIDYLDILEVIGKGGAIIRGWQKSTADLIGFVDADGATSAQEFSKLLTALPSHDGVIASRFLPQAHILERTSWARTLVSRGTVWLVRWLFQMPYSDTQCGAKVFNKATINAVLPKLRTTNMLFDIELLWLLTLRGYHIIEIPTVWVDQPGSASLGSNTKFLKIAFGLLSHLLRLRLNKKYYTS